MRILFLCFSFFAFSATILAQAPRFPLDIKMQNMHLTMETFLSNQPKNRGISAAAWVRFRNTSSAPVSNITLLLNPDLTVTKVVGTRNRALRFSTKLKNIDNSDLELNIISVKLSSTLKPDDSTEFSVQYKGDLKSLSLYGDTFPIDTLNPDFTMIRMDSFIYPVISEPSAKALETYKKYQRYNPTAKITVPQGYSLAGNAIERKRVLSGSREQIELKAIAPSYGFILGLGKYSKINTPALTQYYLDKNSEAAFAANAKATMIIDKYTALLGENAANKKYILADLGNAYQKPGAEGYDFVTFGNYNSVDLEVQLSRLWRIKNYSDNNNGWNIALINLLKNNEKVRELGEISFKTIKQTLTLDKKLAGTALKSYAEKGYSTQSTDAYAFLFAVLHETLGKDTFWQVMRSFRNEFVDFGASDEDLYEHLKNAIRNKNSRKLVIDWMNKGRIMKAINKADTFSTFAGQFK
jgi:hypothetical protein